MTNFDVDYSKGQTVVVGKNKITASQVEFATDKDGLLSLADIKCFFPTAFGLYYLTELGRKHVLRFLFFNIILVFEVIVSDQKPTPLMLKIQEDLKADLQKLDDKIVAVENKLVTLEDRLLKAIVDKKTHYMVVILFNRICKNTVELHYAKSSGNSLVHSDHLAE
ncbi:hypothetical protein Mgra_00006453 [Meloidogyne graminicola]|uniref:Uncharacterized protein n=1 Tax=Meloidogyne graminicola TaxID=189291 RepID=A0A8S9ZLJ0_9BILA|nr:hypothetical protein Mgra_00006453 [Meloidogyne graminicola]